jgi:hypothetical protein
MGGNAEQASELHGESSIDSLSQKEIASYNPSLVFGHSPSGHD